MPRSMSPYRDREVLAGLVNHLTLREAQALTDAWGFDVLKVLQKVV